MSRSWDVGREASEKALEEFPLNELPGQPVARNSRTLVVALAMILIALCCCCLAVAAAGGLIWYASSDGGWSYGPGVGPSWSFEPPLRPSQPTPPPTRRPQPAATPAPTRPPTDTEIQLQAVIVPTRDLRDLAQRLRREAQEIPVVVNATPPVYQIGDRHTFWASNTDTDEHFQVEAELRYMTPHLAMWVEVGVDVDEADLRRSADRFEKEIYPTNREFFGSEWTPGVDNDPRLTILHARGLGDHIAGYFSAADEVSRLAQPYSNEREMFYINIDNTIPGTEFYDSVLAHEFQHMIHWYNDRNEETWVNEGFSELATLLNGFDVGRADRAFSALPDTQLNTWTDDPGGNSEHYGASFLFMTYFLERFGEELTKAVVASPANGPAGFDEALAAAGRSERFEDIFADWLIANYLNNRDIEDGRYGYQRIEPETVAIDQRLRSFPALRESEVSQYAADYVLIQGRGDVTLEFRGATTTRLADLEPHSGRFVWWANRADDSDVRLTREFDLSAVDRATFQMWTWYSIEDKYDFAYVQVSDDGGQTWTILPGKHTVEDNTTGNSFGPGYTGQSEGWILDEIDLSAYAGKRVLVRLEYITDDAVNYPGFFVDDIAIPEIGYQSDFESDDGGWQSEGWIRTDNVLNQRWLLQIIEGDRREVSVRRVAVDGEGIGRTAIDNLGVNGRAAVLVISALAPVTTEVAPYEFTLEPR